MACKLSGQSSSRCQGNTHQRASTRCRCRHLQAATPTPRLSPLREWGPCCLLLLLLLLAKLRLLHLLLPPTPDWRCRSRRRLEGQASPQACRAEHLSRCVGPAR